MSRMFLIQTSAGMKPMTTWNVFIGCKFDCKYCNAKKLAEGRLKNSPRYRDGFSSPHLVEKLLGRRSFKPGQWVFVAYMGDIFFADMAVMKKIFEVIKQFPETSFLFCTKRPSCYVEWMPLLPSNCVLGATIETNRSNVMDISHAGSPWHRARTMLFLSWPRKFIAIEPIMDFDAELITWIVKIAPELVEIGADNYGNNLPEPSWDKVEGLIKGITPYCGAVVRKEGLERLKR